MNIIINLTNSHYLAHPKSSTMTSLVATQKTRSPTLREQKPKQQNTQQTGLIATACATSCYVVESLLYPFDTVRARLQSNREQFTPFFKAARAYHSEEGVRTFFKGYSGTIPCCLVSNFCWFFAYEKCNLLQLNLMNKANLEGEQREKAKSFIPFISGCLAEVAFMGVFVPFNIPKLRMQVDAPKYYYNNLFDGLSKVYYTEGIKKFFKASQLLVSAHVVYSGALIGLYERIRKQILDTKQEKVLTTRESLLATFVASITCGTLLNPFDVIITRFTVASSQFNSVTYSGLAKELITQEGIRGIFKGLPGRLIYGLTHSLVYMPVFEYLRRNYGVQLN